jgi:hypothetical protein
MPVKRRGEEGGDGKGRGRRAVASGPRLRIEMPEMDTPTPMVSPHSTLPSLHFPMADHLPRCPCLLRLPLVLLYAPLHVACVMFALPFGSLCASACALVMFCS